MFFREAVTRRTTPHFDFNFLTSSSNMQQRNADVDFRPEKPKLETPAPPPKPSVRLLGSLKLPDGRPLVDPPTIRIDEFLERVAEPEQENVAKIEVHPPREDSLDSNAAHMSFLLSPDNPMEGFPSFAGARSRGSGSPDEETFSSRYSALFKEDRFLKSFEPTEPREEDLSFSVTLPELPAMPDWPNKREEARKPAYPLESEAVEDHVTASSFSPITFPEFQFQTAPPAPEKPAPGSIVVKPPREFRPVHRNTGPTFHSRRKIFVESVVLPDPIQITQQPIMRHEVEPPCVPESAKTVPLFSVCPVIPASAPQIPSRTGREMIFTESLHKSYTKGKLKIPVLKGVHFSVEPGEFVSIVGQSGSGKSTLLHLLGTLDNPDSGAIYIGDRRIDKLPSAQRDVLRNRSIGFVFQFYHLLPELTTLENVLSPLMVRESVFGYFQHRKAHTEKALGILDRVGLSHRLKHKPRELSGGEMQRAAIARAIVSGPQILLADEPTGNLDAASAREIIELFQKISEETSLTIVMVTHDNQIAQVADRVVRMVDGVIVS